jgi:hypothetical protein
MSKFQTQNTDIQITNPLYEQINSKKTIMRKNEDGHTIILFYNCEYRNIKYKYIIWNLNKNTLTFYTNEKNEQIFRHDVCIDFKIQECFQKYNKIPQTEINFYITEITQLLRNIQNSIERSVILQNKNIEHYITLCSEKNNHSDVLYNMCMCMFKFINEGIILDVFIQHELMRNVMIKRYKREPYIRIHSIDINLIQELDYFNMLNTYIYEKRDDLYDGRTLKIIHDMILFNIIPLLYTINNQYGVYKIKEQFEKTNNIYFLRLYDEFIDEKRTYFEKYRYIVRKYDFLYANFNKDDKKYIEYFYFIILNKAFLHIIRSFLYEMYIISQMLKQNNTFCIYYGDVLSYNSIQNYLKEYNFK